MQDKITYDDWLSAYEALTVEGIKLWSATGLPDNIRLGWLESYKNNNLFACGPYSVPFDVVESIEEETDQMFKLAGVHRSRVFYNSVVEDLNKNMNILKNQLKEKEKVIDSLLEEVIELRKNQKEMIQKQSINQEAKIIIENF